MSGQFVVSRTQLNQMVDSALNFANMRREVLHQEEPVRIAVYSKEKFRQLTIAACAIAANQIVGNCMRLWFSYRDVIFFHDSYIKE